MKHSVVFDLWCNIKEMSAELGVSVSELLDMRGSERLPDAKHDEVILVKARDKGVTITKDDLHALRNARQNRIGAIYKALGGPKVVADQLGTSPNALRIAKSRGRIPQRFRYDLTEMAKKKKVTVAADLFT